MTDAAATLSLEISTENALPPLERLNQEYFKLHANAEKPLAPVGISELGKESAESAAKVRTLEAEIATLSAKLQGVGSAGKQMVSWSTSLGNGFKGSVQVAKSELEKFVPMVKDMYAQAASAKSEFLRLQESEERANALKLKQIQESRDIGNYEAEAAKYAKRNELIQAYDLELYNERSRAEARLKELEQSRQADAYFAEAAKYAKRNELIQAYDLELYNERSRSEARLKSLQESRDMEMYTETARAAEAQLALERKYILASEQQRLKAAIDARKLMDSGYSGNLATQFAPQTLSTASAATVAELTAQHAALTPAVVKSTTAMKGFSNAANEAHSFARGLSGSLGTLWMTYGSMVPLLAGAALAGGFKAAATAGSEFAYQLTFVKALGGESAKAVEDIGQSALNLSKTSLYGPTELANGLRMLSQAGLNAAQSMEALPSVMQLATVGEMSMEQASLTLIGVMNAFGASLSDLPHIGDMFSKAAALSQTSVSQMAEAMKTASVVHDQYGASVEDTATAITLLAKVNITGTAAGTSYRNMLKDIYTPSKEAAKTLEQLGIKAKDANGNLREAPEILKDLKEKLQGFTQASQTDILGKIFSERGGKEAIQMLSAVGAKWDELKSSIANSDGFMSGVTSELEMTTKGRFQQALNTMRANLISAFDASEGSVRGLADSLRSLADSPEFVAGINVIIGGMASLAKVLVDLLPVLTGFGIAWAALKAGMALEGIIGATVLGFGALTTAIKEVATVIKFTEIANLGQALLSVGTAAATAGNGGVAALALGLRALPFVGLAALAGTFIYNLYQMATATTPAVESAKSFNDALGREIDKLKQSNDELEKRRNLLNGNSVAESDMLQAQRAKVAADLATAKEAAAKATGDAGRRGIGTEGNVITTRNAVIDLEAQLKDLDQKLASKNSEQYRGRLLSMGVAAGEARVQIEALKKDIEFTNAHLKSGEKSVSVSTADMERYVSTFSRRDGASAKQVREFNEQFNRMLQQARKDALGYGNNTFTSGKDAKGSNAASTDAYKADIEALKGYIAEYEREYAQFVTDQSKLQAEGSISELQMLTANWEKRNSLLEAAMVKQAEIYDKAGTQKNGKADQAKALEDYNKLADAQTAAQSEYEKKRVELTNKTNDQLLQLEVSLGGKLESERNKALAVLNGQFAKVLQEAVNNGDVELIEKLGQIKAAFLKAADIKDVANSINSGLSNVSVGLTNLGSDVDKLEADMERDGGWISRIFNTSEIQTLINERLPALRAEIARLEAEMANMPEGSEESAAYLKIQKDLAKARKEADKFANYVPKVWKDTVKQIDSTFHDGFVAIFAKGETDWSAFCKRLAASFKTTVVDAIYEMFARPFVMNIVANVAGVFGVSSSASAAQTAGSVGGVAQTANSAYSLYNGGYSNMYGSFANSAVGQTLGLSSVGSGLATAGGSVVSTTSLAGIEMASQGVVQTSGLTSLGSTIGAAIPYVGAAIAAVSLLTGALGKRGGVKTEGDAYGTLTGTSLSLAATDRTGDNWITGSNSNAVVESLLKPVGTSVASLIKSMGGSANGLSFNLGFSTDTKGTAQDNIQSGVMDAAGNYVYRNGRNAERGTYATELQLETQRMMVAAVQASDVSQVYKDVANSVNLYTASAEELNTVLSNLTAITTLRTAFDNLGLGADNLSKSLIDAAGGTSTLATNLDSYYQNFYSETERNANTLKQVSDALSGLGLTLPTTRDGFRALVDAQDLTTASGQAAFATLMSVNSAFASVVPAATSVSNAIKTLASETEKLQIELLNAQGKTAEANAEQRRIDITGMSSAEVAVYDYNAALRAQVDTLTAANTRLSSIGTARSNLIDAIFDAQLSGMDTSGQIDALKSREAELWASLDGGNLDAASTLQETLLKRISIEASLKDDATKAQLESAQTLLDSMKSVAAYASSMRNEVLNLQAGDLSPLSYIDQLAAAQTQWQETLAKAQAGDTTAQSSLSSVGNAYLKEAQSYYGANGDYAATFNSVTGGMSRFASSAPTETVIESQQTLVTQLTKAASEQTNTSKEQVAALRSIDNALAKQQGATEAQLRQNGEGYTAILAALKKIDERLATVESTNRQAALA